MSNHTDTASAALAKVTTAATAGDQTAQAALDALTQAADKIADSKTTGSELGRAEARRFGTGETR